MGHFVPHTDAELAAMLADIGLASLDSSSRWCPRPCGWPAAWTCRPGLSEADVLAEMERLAVRNRTGADLVCFAGAGAYDHEVPSATTRLTFRSEFVTAYTPYQPEVAQGVLQALFEYQTLVARLAGLPVANASLYDGASAAVEAVNLAVGGQGPPDGVGERRHPSALAAGPGHLRPGHRPSAGRRAAARRGHRLGRGTSRRPSGRPAGRRPPTTWGPWRTSAPPGPPPTSRAPCCWSASIRSPPGCCGRRARTAPTWWWGRGSPSARRCRSAVRTWACSPAGWSRSAACPGRLVGRTVDTEGRPAYVTTLRAREQDIRREKASSNVCTNQTLIAVAAMIQLSWLGTSGLRELALRCARGTRYAREAALAIPGCPLLAPGPDPARVRPAAPGPGRDGGGPHGRGGVPGRRAGRRRRRGGADDGDGLLVAVTERRTRDEIDAFVSALEKVVR